MKKNYSELTKRISGEVRKLRKDIPDTMQAFSALAQAATRDGALDKKTKELIALAIGVAVRCDGCIGFHTEAWHDLAPRARKCKKPSVWRSIWAAVRR
jgi:alkylhydroperoxidase/carboxymuconolactone decarboxylase family protein YurZ